MRPHGLEPWTIHEKSSVLVVYRSLSVLTLKLVCDAFMRSGLHYAVAHIQTR